MEDGAVAAEPPVVPVETTFSVKQALKNQYGIVRASIAELKELKKSNKRAYDVRLVNILAGFSPIPFLPGPQKKLAWYCVRNIKTVQFILGDGLFHHYNSKLKLFKFRKYKKARSASRFLRKRVFRKYRPRFQRSRRYSRFKRRSYGRRRSYRRRY